MRILTPLLIASALAACGQADLPPPPAPTVPVATANTAVPAAPTAPVKRYTVLDFSADMASGIGIENGMPKADAQAKIASYFIPQAEGNGTIETEADTLVSGISRIVVTQTGLMDDSVSAHQFIAMFKTAPSGEQTLFNYGLRIKCARGENTTDWQNTPCP